MGFYELMDKIFGGHTPMTMAEFIKTTYGRGPTAYTWTETTYQPGVRYHAARPGKRWKR